MKEAVFPSFKVRAGSRLAHALRREGVKNTAELRRIAALPRRPVESYVDVDRMTSLVRKPGGTMKLMRDQARMLAESAQYGSAFVGASVGSGKSLMSMLAAAVVDARRPLVLMPASAIGGFQEQRKLMDRHWRIHDGLMIASYESLSSKANRAFLDSRLPDYVYADEAHYLKDRTAARTARFLRYFEAHPETYLTPLSGSFIDRSLLAYAHLMRLALRDRCPLPDDEDGAELREWAAAIDSGVDDENRWSRGALQVFVDRLSGDERDACEDDLHVTQRAIGKLLTETPGVIFSSEATTSVALHIRERTIAIPPVVTEAFARLRDTYELPDGDEISDGMALWRAIQQLSQGYYMRPVWPTGEPDREWLDARKAWHRYVRTTIADSRGQFDTMAEVEDACKRHARWSLLKDDPHGARAAGVNESLSELQALPMRDSPEYRAWLDIGPRHDPATETVWLSPFVVEHVSRWLDDGTGVAWVDSIPLGNALRKAGYAYYGAGRGAEMLAETVSCAASIKACGTGLNLQQFNRGLVVVPPTRGRVWEQLLGRFDRTGQKAPRVTFEVLLHARELWRAFDMARLDARYAASPGVQQKLLNAHIDLQTDDAAMIAKSMSDDPLWRYTIARSE